MFWWHVKPNTKIGRFLSVRKSATASAVSTFRSDANISLTTRSAMPPQQRSDAALTRRRLSNFFFSASGVTTSAAKRIHGSRRAANATSGSAL